MFTEKGNVMNKRLYFSTCLALLFAAHSVAGTRDDVQTEKRVSIWKKLAEAPLLVTLSVKNAQDEDEKVFYVGQPILLRVSIQNMLADALYSNEEPVRRAIQSNGVDVAQASIKLCAPSCSWLSFIKVYIGVAEENVIWFGDLSSASNRVRRNNQVDINPVSVSEYIPELESHHVGQYQIWVVFDNTSLNAGANPDLSRLRLKSNTTAIRVVSPTNEFQKAWVLAEKGSRAESRKQYDVAESYLTQAIKIAPLLGRGPRIGTHRMYDLNMELGAIYESWGRYSDAARVVEHTRAYVERLPKSVRDEMIRQIDERLSRYREKETPMH